ncbi:MAG TPA: response regulator [Patescibacteria group bacterium]|nr:response regulator [Patescibacteria group bacterium]
MGPKVLLVDDDRLVHHLYQPHVERAGYQMLSAFNGIEAVQLAVRELPQVIVMDIMMPQMDGISAMREIKQDEKTKNIPIIVMTANPHYHLSQMESQWAGAAVFLTKPFGPASLVSALQRIVPVPNTEAPSSGVA